MQFRLFIALVINCFILLKGGSLAHVDLNLPTSQPIYIYDGPGTSAVAVKQTKHTLKKLIYPGYILRTVGPEELNQGTWIKDAALFLMPGGCDIPYLRSLKGGGNQQIQSFIQGGGAYLGLCAGAYYASKHVIFAPGTIQEVRGDRELAFFPGVAEGPTLKPWDHNTNVGAEVAVLEWKGSQSPFPINHLFSTYYNGGGHFENAEAYPQVTILAHYVTTSPLKAAIIEIAVGKGRVILSGVHCEFDPELFDMTDPFLLPVQQKLRSKDMERLALMAHLLERLGIKTTYV